MNKQMCFTLNRDDKLRDDWEDLSTTLFEHIEDTLDCKEAVWVLLFSNAFEEDGQVMMVIKLLDFNLPIDLVLWAMLNGYWEVTSIVETTELA